MPTLEKRLYPEGLARKEILRINAADIAEFMLNARDSILMRYTWHDSSLDGNGWVLHDGDYPLQASFKKLIPPHHTRLSRHIEQLLQEKRGNAVGIEFGGTGSKLFKGFEPQFFKKSLGVTLCDHQRNFGSYQGARSHVVLEGDILAPQTYTALENWLGEDKADLIIERMGKGLEFIPREPYTVSKILQRWYGLLGDGGVMFVQVPKSMNHLLHRWKRGIPEEQKENLEIQYSLEGGEDCDGPSSILFIQKLKGAPGILPMLSPREVRKISRDC